MFFKHALECGKVKKTKWPGFIPDHFVSLLLFQFDNILKRYLCIVKNNNLVIP